MMHQPTQQCNRTDPPGPYPGQHRAAAPVPASGKLRARPSHRVKVHLRSYPENPFRLVCCPRMACTLTFSLDPPRAAGGPDKPPERRKGFYGRPGGRRPPKPGPGGFRPKRRLGPPQDRPTAASHARRAPRNAKGYPKSSGAGKGPQNALCAKFCTAGAGALLPGPPWRPSFCGNNGLGPSHRGLARQAVAGLRGRHRSGAPPPVAGV